MDQKRIRLFYKAFLGQRPDSIGMWLAAAFMELLFGVLMAVPYQEVKKDPQMLILMLLFGYLGTMFYIGPYLSYRENGKMTSIYEKLKYLPVDYREIQKMRVCYMSKYVMKTGLVLMLFQFATSKFSGTFAMENIVYVVVIGILWPILSNLPMAWFTK